MGGFAPTLPIGTLNLALSNFAREFRNNNYVGDRIAPRVPVDRQSFQYIIFDQSNLRLDRNVVRAPGTSPQEDRMTYSAAPYMCVSHALKARIPYESEKRSNEAGFSLRRSATQRLIDKLNLSREAYIAALALTGPNTTPLSGASMWDPTAGGHPLIAVEGAKAAIAQTGVQANLLILSDPVFRALKNHPDILGRFLYKDGTSAAVTLGMLSEAFGVECVLGSAIAEDKGGNRSYVWGLNAVLAYSQPVSSEADLSAMKTFDWSEAPDTVGGYGVLEYPDPDLAAKADIVAADWYWDTRITGPETLYTFTNCV